MYKVVGWTILNRLIRHRRDHLRASGFRPGRSGIDQVFPYHDVSIGDLGIVVIGDGEARLHGKEAVWLLLNTIRDTFNIISNLGIQSEMGRDRSGAMRPFSFVPLMIPIRGTKFDPHLRELHEACQFPSGMYRTTVGRMSSYDTHEVDCMMSNKDYKAHRKRWTYYGPGNFTAQKKFMFKATEMMKNIKVGIVIIAGKPYIQIPLDKYENNKEKIKHFLENEPWKDLWTGIGWSLKLARESLEKDSADEKIIVMVSDGDQDICAHDYPTEKCPQEVKNKVAEYNQKSEAKKGEDGGLMVLATSGTPKGQWLPRTGHLRVRQTQPTATRHRQQRLDMGSAARHGFSGARWRQRLDNSGSTTAARHDGG
ncbi:hypothetical protein RB195_011608 [Necator americanus]|uniref:VWFA domain-containing protein n=1 Tax=Necator americanus TaxID=51031 RepID=A0ABR1D4Y3_NECAM